MSDSQANPTSPPPSSSGALDRALGLVEFLRARCPWDTAQTPHSLRRYLLEESHEVVDAIERGDDADLRDELGDLLLNLAFQVVIAEERGVFDRQAVIGGLEEKMRRRHPHLYGLGEAEPWETIKARERSAAADATAADGDEERAAVVGLLDDLPLGADPLEHAQRVQERVARVGFDWPDYRGAMQKVHEEIEEVRVELEGGDAARIEDEVGDLLFAAVNLARLAGVHAPTALRRANAKFTRRFGVLEESARRRGIDMETAGLAALDELWDEAKRGER